MIQRMLAIWSLVPLSFLNPAWTSGSSHFMYCWSLSWRILSLTLPSCEMSAIVPLFEHSFIFALLWHWNGNWPFPVLWPLLSFSNLLAYWVQHFNSIIFIELEIAQLEFHQLSLFLSLLWCFLRPTWLRTLGCLALGGWSHHHGYLDNQLVTLGETKLGRKWKVITGKYC